MNKTTDPFSERGFGDSAPWLDFVNSELWDGFGNFTDMLRNPAWRGAYFRYWKCRMPMKGKVPLRELELLRSQLRSLVKKASAKEKLRIEELRELNVWLKVPVYPCLNEDQNGLHLRLIPVQTGWKEVLASIAASFAESLVLESGDRLKICSNDDCRWIFIDTTKGNVRRWCNSKTCGNRERVRRSRARP